MLCFVKDFWAVSILTAVEKGTTSWSNFISFEAGQFYKLLSEIVLFYVR